MREMNTRDIQVMALELMKEIHFFCVKNDIKYTLAYGTLLGAIRHGGFIPWDDDMDVMMPRPDYDRFLQLYKNDKYYLKSSYEKDCYTNFSRLFDVEKTLTIQKAKPCDRDVGVFIDIFPVDGIYDDPIVREKHYQKIRKLAKGRISYRHILPEIHEGLFVSRIHALKALIILILRNGGDIVSMQKELNRLSTEVKFGDTTFCSYYCCSDALKANKQEVFPTEVFQKYELCKFETEEFYISSFYDEMLKTMYGDYMKLPPEKDRTPRHGFAKFYWKE